MSSGQERDGMPGGDPRVMAAKTAEKYPRRRPKAMGGA